MDDRRHFFEFEFHAVGQGLFASGSLKDGKTFPRPIFRWVYDCGTSSSKVLVDEAIDHLKARSKGYNQLDLVTLSHFDEDHINGIAHLLSEFRVETLLLPYMPTWQRLLIAFESGFGPRSPLMGFFINPTTYLTAVPGSEIGRIVYVTPGGQASPPRTGTSPTTPSPSSPGFEIHFDRTKPEDPTEYEMLAATGERTITQFMRNGTVIELGGMWEFVPYNDSTEAEVDIVFVSRVNQERNRLLSNAPKRRRTAALKRLKRIYDQVFGDSSEQRNVISLFLYGGPLYETFEGISIWPYVEYVSRPRKNVFRPWQHDRWGPKCSVLYSGDGYLDTAERLERMVQFFNADRISRIGAFQVMHHGAEPNWHKGVATRISPAFSVFSSDPERKQWGHPHPPVLRDFWLFNPIQADKNHRASFRGVMIPRGA